MINNAVELNSKEFEGYYETPRLNLISLATGLNYSKVLEIGCGGGANLQALKKLNPKCSTTGIEIREEAIDAAIKNQRVDRIFQHNIMEEAKSPIAKERFDLIVLSHVLEHFQYPELLLKIAKGYMEPGGYMLIALPNIRHASVIYELLLKGEFEYQSSGILDNTHLRFFTSKSAIRFLIKEGLEITRFIRDIDGTKSRLINMLTLGFAADFSAFGLNFLVKQKNDKICDNCIS